MICLLLVSPMAALGQTNLPKYESKGWWHLFVHGDTIRTKTADGHRTGKHYMVLEDGLGALTDMNFVDGFNFGPAATFGYLCRDYSRWELDVDTRYAVSRKAWMGGASLRYYTSPEYFSWAELFIQRKTEDFDREPLLGPSQRHTAASLFGWNGCKLYLRSAFGAKGSMPLMRDLQLTASAWWERREQMVNHRCRTNFGVQGEDNYPRMRGLDEEAMDQSQLLNWRDDQLLRLDVQLSYSLGSIVRVCDDLHYMSDFSNPVLTLRVNTAYNGDWDCTADYGTLREDADNYTDFFWLSGFRYLCLELNVQQTLEAHRRRWQYFGSIGCFVNRNNIGLADMRHFDASHYLWQESNTLTWFSLLTNYELSTSRRWMELHGEYLRQYNRFFGQYLQAHFLSVAEHCPHYELSYGWQLPQNLRVGLTAGMDGSTFDGVGFNLTLPLR